MKTCGSAHMLFSCCVLPALSHRRWDNQTNLMGLTDLLQGCSNQADTVTMYDIVSVNCSQLRYNFMATELAFLTGDIFASFGVNLLSQL